MEVTPVQAAALLGKSERTIQRWIQQKKLPAHLLTDGSYRVNVADLEQFTAQQDETLLARIETLEQEVAELKRRLDGLSVPRPWHEPARLEQHIIPISHITPGALVSARRFAELHNIGKDRMQAWIKRGAFETTPEPHGDTTQHNLTQEQQAGVIVYWQSTGVLYQPCQDCPHTSS